MICRKGKRLRDYVLTPIYEAHGCASRCQSPLFPSTKSRFLCAFGVWNPCFRAFRAQNRGFCALFAFGTPIFWHFEHKNGMFVSETAIFSWFWLLPSTKSAFLCAFVSKFLPDGTPCQQQTSSGGEKYSGLASNLAHLGRIC